MKLDSSRQIFEKSSNIKFHQNLSSGSRVVACGQKTVSDLSNTASCSTVCKCLIFFSGPKPLYKNSKDFTLIYIYIYISRYSDSLRTRRSGD